MADTYIHTYGGYMYIHTYIPREGIVCMYIQTYMYMYMYNTYIWDKYASISISYMGRSPNNECWLKDSENKTKQAIPII